MQSPRETGDRSKLPDPVVHEFAPVAHALLACEDRRDFMRGGDAGRIKGLIQEAIDETNPRVLSLDVFDTLLLRDGKSEARRFWEISVAARRRVAANLGSKSSAIPAEIDFLTARADAMAQCYRTRKAVDGCREGRIGDILRAARRSLGLPAATDAILLETELSCEIASLALNPVLADVARDFREAGGKVVLVSDMYLGEAEIGAILKGLDRDALADEIFSSADHVVSKRSGKIFGLIEQRLDEPADAFLHIGDALEGDVMAPRRAGWKALHFPISRAEAAKRAADLESFIAEMDAKGCDVTRWAKV
jgi:FMN phosphatase YigB (HAD superfamily)